MLHLLVIWPVLVSFRPLSRRVSRALLCPPCCGARPAGQGRANARLRGGAKRRRSLDQRDAPRYCKALEDVFFSGALRGQAALLGGVAEAHELERGEDRFGPPLSRC